MQSGKTNKYVLTGTLKAPMIEAIFEDSKSLKWTVERVDGGSLSGERTAAAVVEVTCSDGIYCNGIERLIRGQCVKPTALPCIDPAGDPCASYQCIEATQRCAPDPIGGPSCPTCVSPSCKPSCNKKTCGDDGCGGSCGPPCGGGQFCVQGACQIVTQLGTCAVPDPLFGASGAVVPAGGIVLDVFGDNRYVFEYKYCCFQATKTIFKKQAAETVWIWLNQCASQSISLNTCTNSPSPTLSRLWALKSV